MKKTITEIKNTLGGINSRLDEAEVHISNLEDKVAENTQFKTATTTKKNPKTNKQKQNKQTKNEDSLRSFWVQH